MAQRNTSRTASYHWSGGDLRRAQRPSPSTHTPLYSGLPTVHTLRAPPRTFHLSLAPPPPPPHLLPSFFPSFPLQPSIPSVSTPSVFTESSCQDKCQRRLVHKHASALCTVHTCLIRRRVAGLYVFNTTCSQETERGRKKNPLCLFSSCQPVALTRKHTALRQYYGLVLQLFLVFLVCFLDVYGAPCSTIHHIP